jgi:hypothetical protein
MYAGAAWDSCIAMNAVVIAIAAASHTVKPVVLPVRIAQFLPIDDAADLLELVRGRRLAGPAASQAAG